MPYLLSTTENVKNPTGWRTVLGTYAEILGFIATAGTSFTPSKDKTNIPAVCVAPLSSEPAEGLSRSGAKAHPTAFLMLDVDECTPEQYERVKAATNSTLGIIYTTANHNKPKKNAPACPRFRAVLCLDRPVTPGERRRLVVRFMDAWGLPVDASNLTDTQPMFVACKGAEITYSDIEAVPVNVAEALKTAPTSEEIATRYGKKKAGERVPVAEKTLDAAQEAAKTKTEEKTAIAQGLDPILLRLQALGLTEGEQRPDGGIICVCPFADEHTTATGARDTSTVFYPAGTGTRRDKNGEAFLLGFFSCLHAHCKDRPLSEYCERLGVNYPEYVRYCNGDTVTRFKSVESSTRFRVDSVGTYAQRFTKEGEPIPEKRIAGAVRATGTLSDTEGNGWALLLEWKDRLGKRKNGRFDYANIAKQNASDAVGGLVDSGLVLYGRGSNSLLLEYLSSIPTIGLPHITAVNQCGWHKDNATRVFILGDTVIGKKNESEGYCFNGDKESAAKLSTKGTLEAWKTAVASRAEDSSRLGLAICTAFAAPCLSLLNVEGGCFNIHGSSSKGKSLSLKVGASVYGSPAPSGYIHSWDATATGLEQIMAGHNDLLLCLDEAKSCKDKRDIGRTIYALANGSGRIRGGLGSNNKITLRQTLSWRVLGLSSSEKTTAELLTEAGDSVNAGQEIRLADVPAVAESDALGIFEKVRISGAVDAEEIEHATANQYGTAGKAWIGFLASNHATATERLAKHFEAFKENFTKRTAIGTQAGRVLDRFAICAAAGEVATEEGLTNWAPGFASMQVAKCARDCLPRFEHDREKVHALKALREATTTSIGRFIDADAGAHTPATEIYGYRYATDGEGRKATPFETFANEYTTEAVEAPSRPTAFLIYPSVFEKLCSPLHKKTAAHWLESEGVLKVIGARRGAAFGVSRLRDIAGRGSQCSGYLILGNALERLAEKLDI